MTKSQQLLTVWKEVKEKIKPLTKITILTNEQKRVISDLETITNGNFAKGEWVALFPPDHPKWKEFLTNRKQPKAEELIAKYIETSGKYKW